MKRFLLLTIILFWFFSNKSWAIKIKVGVYSGYNIQKVEFTYVKGNYQIIGDSVLLDTLSNNQFATLSLQGDQILLKKGNKNIGNFSTIIFRPLGKDFSMQLKPKQPVIKSRIYNDAFIVKTASNKLTLINNVSLQNYLMGVLESEAGSGRPIEYYKAQAVISRTYALKHLNRHEADGFNVCDRVHCQAYYHQLKYTPAIRKAVIDTKGIYIVDSMTQELIQGVFSANCGGETSSADYVWNKNIPYLQPFIDTFCIHTFQAKWTKKITKSSWKSFLINNFNYPINDTYWKERIFSFKQEHRKAFYLSPVLGIPLRDLRYHFHLKSTFFSCHPEGDYIVLNGRGFGHGVGLCQEGAMNMAKYGYNYKEILAFYFKGIVFKQLFEADFFNQSQEFSFKF